MERCPLRRRRKEKFHGVHQSAWGFLVIIAVLLTLVVAQIWLQERLKIRLLERLPQVLLDVWLKPNRAYQLGLIGKAGAQPDQRMQEDCRLFAGFTTELGVGHKPAWVFMDEATSALNDDSQAAMLSLFEGELAGASLLSIGHRPGPEEFHGRTLHIRKTKEGAVLLARQRPQPQRIIPSLVHWQHRRLIS